MGRVSVPLWPVILSDRLHILGLLSHQLANVPQVHPEPTLESAFQGKGMPPRLLSGISQAFAWVSQCSGQVTYVLLTRSPLADCSARSTCMY